MKWNEGKDQGKERDHILVERDVVGLLEGKGRWVVNVFSGSLLFFTHCNELILLFTKKWAVVCPAFHEICSVVLCVCVCVCLRCALMSWQLSVRLPCSL